MATLNAKAPFFFRVVRVFRGWLILCKSWWADVSGGICDLEIPPTWVHSRTGRGLVPAFCHNHTVLRRRAVRTSRPRPVRLTSGGFHEQYSDGLLDEAINSRGFKRLFSAERLKAYRESFQELKGNQQVCATTVAMTQNLLLADRGDMDHIIEAVRKIQAHSGALVKASG